MTIVPEYSRYTPLPSTFGRFDELQLGGHPLLHVSITAMPSVTRLPMSLKVILENLMRQATRGVDVDSQLEALMARRVGSGLSFFPARVLLQDLLGVPLLVDLASLRDAIAKAGGDPKSVNPKVPADLVIDHSLRVDLSATRTARGVNLALEHERNVERFRFLRWCQQSFDNLRVIPPGKGILHQINFEYLGKVVWTEATPQGVVAYPDTLVGTDSHTTMINGLGILGWGVGGIEAEAVMLGKPVSLALPEVVGVNVIGTLQEGAMPTDLVLTITERLRSIGVVGKFVEFFGAGLDALSVPDRGTIANMAPECGATCVYFPVDERALGYLRMTGRDAEQVRLVEAYSKAQALWRDDTTQPPEFETVVTLDLRTVRRSIAGPRNPEERIDLENAPLAFAEYHQKPADHALSQRAVLVEDQHFALQDGSIIIAAITSCTNTSNPVNMVAAGLLARNAVRKGLAVKPWVKTSFAPGSQVVAAVLERAQLQQPLDALGFQVVGFGCTTCNGMSGPIARSIAAAIERERLVAVAVLSGNRNFEGRIHPNVRAAYLASPALVVAYAIAGSMTIDVIRDPLGLDEEGRPVFLRDIWPSSQEIAAVAERAYEPRLFREKYAELFDGDATWLKLASNGGDCFPWQPSSTYIRRAPYFEGLTASLPQMSDITGLRALAILGDSITTDHISPSGEITLGSAAAELLLATGVAQSEFNSYGTRRGNHEVAIRATFANIRLRNRIVPGSEGSITRLMPEGMEVRLFDAAVEYGRRGVPLVIVAGQNYGCGSSRDWAAKGVSLLGVKAVIAESFERIHRTNLIGMGVLPLQFARGTTAGALGLDGSQTFDLVDLDASLGVRGTVQCIVRRTDGTSTRAPLHVGIETEDELHYLRSGGILPAVWREYVGNDTQPARPS